MSRELLDDCRVVCGIDKEHPDHVYIEFQEPGQPPIKTWLPPHDAQQFAKNLLAFTNGAQHNVNIAELRKGLNLNG